jgi:hypothetical protein
VIIPAADGALMKVKALDLLPAKYRRDRPAPDPA